MKACRVLVLDTDEHCFVSEHIIPPLMAASPRMQVVYFGQRPQWLRGLPKGIRNFDPHMIVLGNANLFQAFSLAAEIRHAHLNTRAVVFVEDNSAVVLRISCGEIGDIESVGVRRFGEYDCARILYQSEDKGFMQSMREQLGLRTLIGESESFVSEIRRIPAIAESLSTVLITGETGTGKEVVARAIHYLSSRRDKPFLPVNCGAIPADLIENEFFGHEAGAYTNASARAVGVIKQAEGGTLFLDEINCLPLLTQSKLLRFIQEKEFKPLGSALTQKSDVRIVAASNEDLEQAVKDGRFRKDLFYRLNIVPMCLPPLRKRVDDIPILARHFLIQCSERMHKRVDGFTREAITKLLTHRWEGNIRELEYVVERAVVFAEGTLIRDQEILFGKNDVAPKSFREAKRQAVDEMEKGFIQGLLISHQGNVAKAAEAAQKHPRAFWHLIYKHRINVEKYRTVSE